jgi:hypothetical protein
MHACMRRCASTVTDGLCACPSPLQTQTTPLMLAARANNVAIVDLLLEESVIVPKLNTQNNVSGKYIDDIMDI